MKFIRNKRRELYTLNKELKSVNRKLLEANETREEHIALVMDLCSSYINKLELYKETIRRIILSNQIQNLYKMRDSPQLIKSELKEFFHNFDKSILALFPNFVEDFNKLLTEKGQIKLKGDEHLNTNYVSLP